MKRSTAHSGCLHAGNWAASRAHQSNLLIAGRLVDMCLRWKVLPIQHRFARILPEPITMNSVKELGLREDSNSRQVPLLYNILARLQRERPAPTSYAPVSLCLLCLPVLGVVLCLSSSLQLLPSSFASPYPFPFTFYVSPHIIFSLFQITLPPRFVTCSPLTYPLSLSLPIPLFCL